MQLVVKIESIPHVTGKKVKDAMFRKTQGEFSYSLARGLASAKFPKEKDNDYLVVLFNGSEQECKDMQHKFWEEGSLNHAEMLEQINNMKTTRLIKSSMLKIVNKSQKFRDYINYMKAMLNILVTTHILEDMTLTEVETHFLN